MTSNIVTHSRFQLDKMSADTLKSMGVEVLSDFPSDDELGLDAPKSGEKVVGTLTEEEFAVFVDLIGVSREIDHISKSITARKLREVADKIGGGEDTLTAAISSVENIKTGLFETEEDEKYFFQLVARSNLLRYTFYWVVAERFNCHEWRTGVRSKRRFVTIEKRRADG